MKEMACVQSYVYCQWDSILDFVGCKQKPDSLHKINSPT